MTTASASPTQPLRATSIGNNPVLLWGMTNTERTRRIVAAAGHEWMGANASNAQLIANDAFAWDPETYKHLAAQPGLVITKSGVPVIAHCTTGPEAAAVIAAISANGALANMQGLTIIAIESGWQIENKQLRKRFTPFIEQLVPENVRSIERASYFGAYKGVTDILTKYLWPEWALVLTRIAARLHITPNMVTAVGATLCVIATVCFAYGYYWTGMALGLIFMVLDTVDGKLARCTITSSWWGNVFDHGVDLIHPPFWYYFWAVGLGAVGLALSDTTFWIVQAVLMAGYILQRVIEGAFIRMFGMHIHVWRKFDSDFRLITARRNPNMILLFVGTLFGRPDWALIAVAIWTVLSLVVHVIQLLQAWIAKARGETLISWLSR